MQHSKKSSCWSKLHLRQRQVGRNLVVVGYILCSHFRVKMTSWGFQGPTHTGHKLRSQSRGDSTVRGDFTVKGDSTVKRDPTVSVTSGSHLNHRHFQPWVFFFIKYMQHGLFVFARRRIVTFQTPADYFLTLCFPLLLKGIVRDTPMIYQRL